MMKQYFPRVLRPAYNVDHNGRSNFTCQFATPTALLNKMTRFDEPVDCKKWARTYLDDKFDDLTLKGPGYVWKFASPKDFSSTFLEVSRHSAGVYTSNFSISMSVPFTYYLEGHTVLSGQLEIPKITYSPREDSIGPCVPEVPTSDIENARSAIMALKQLGESELQSFIDESLQTVIPYIKEIFVHFREDLIVENVFEEPQEALDLFSIATTKAHTTFRAPVDFVYAALLNADVIVAWTRSLPIMSQFPPAIGGQFKIYGGRISGKLLSITDKEKIVQLWRLQDWPPGHYAQVEFDISRLESGTKLDVNMSGIPVGQEEVVKKVIEEKYFMAMTKAFEW